MPGRRTYKVRLSNHRWNNIKQQFYKIVEHQVVEIKEKPSKVALGCAIGFGVNFLPTFGLGFLLAFLLATLFRGNQVSATAISLLTGPLIPLKYALNLLIGGLIQAQGAGSKGFIELIVDQYTQLFMISSFQDKMLSVLDFFGSTFMVGSLINIAFFGIGFYFCVELLLKNKFRPNPLQ